MKAILFGIMLLLSFVLCAQKREVGYVGELSGYAGRGGVLPFWMGRDRWGAMPDRAGGVLRLGLFSDFREGRKIQTAYGFSGVGIGEKGNNRVSVDELYASARWRRLRLDIGMIHPDTEYNGVSSTNGDFVQSGNARVNPGYNLRSEYIPLPFIGKVLAFRFSYGDYRMIGKRYAEKVRLHHKSLFLRITPHRRWDIIVGLDHYAQWGGISPDLGKQPSSLKDYIRIVVGSEGGSDASGSAQNNALGNHLGREHLRINYKGDRYTLTFYHDIPFEDGSGTDFRSFPDGIYAFYYGAGNRSGWCTDVIYEFLYTKYQSGPYHDRPATPAEMEKQDPDAPGYGWKKVGGRDDYFLHGEYKSGWTTDGRIIGTPFLLPNPKNKEGFVIGMYNNRVIAHYLGIKGWIAGKVSYLGRFSYSLNYGRYREPFERVKRQCSWGMEVGIPWRRLPFKTEAGIYGDEGKLLRENVGVMLRLTINN
ncbi:capsule assembly Wzi family protein [Sanguibacteroides justesenii]|nr:capsule assembly Wzi family protein [Sanguibacteroides justesenii]